MNEPLPFDREGYQKLNPARATTAKNLLSQLKGQVDLKTAADIGCGLGFFSNLLYSLGYQVTALDGREENVQEAKRRYPEITFVRGNAEDLPKIGLGMFDLAFCFGLLYHLENPFRAIRYLSSITSKVLMVESMIAPGTEPAMQLLDEYQEADQGLNYVAFYPTESCLVKMLYRSDFPFVYGFATQPDFALYHGSECRKRERTMLVASKLRLGAAALVAFPEPRRPWDIWSIQPGPWRVRLDRAKRLVGKRGR